MASIDWLDEDVLWLSEDRAPRRMLVVKPDKDAVGDAVAVLVWVGGVGGAPSLSPPGAYFSLNKDQAQAVAQALAKFTMAASSPGQGQGGEIDPPAHWDIRKPGTTAGGAL